MIHVLAICLVLVSPSFQRSLSIPDLKAFIDKLGDEFFTHDKLPPQVITDNNEEVPHPVKVNNWGHGLGKALGQVSAVSVNPSDQPVIFHRGPVVWDKSTFGWGNTMRNPVPINVDTIVTLDTVTGDIIENKSFGKDIFLMPHGLTIDAYGNYYVTDVGLHQVMRFAPGDKQPNLVLGRREQPGRSHDQFCMPTSVAVASNGDFFVADGYCNSRIMRFNGQGQLVKIIKGNWEVPHSIALFEDDDVICVANREGKSVECVKAGLEKTSHAQNDDTGATVVTYKDERIGKPYAISGKGTALLVLNGDNPAYGLTIDTAAGQDESQIIDVWGTDKNEIKSPHDLAISQSGDAVYVVEISTDSTEKIHKYEVINNSQDAGIF